MSESCDLRKQRWKTRNGQTCQFVQRKSVKSNTKLFGFPDRMSDE